MQRERFSLPHLRGDVANETHIDDFVVDLDARHRQGTPDLATVLAGDLDFAACSDDPVDRRSRGSRRCIRYDAAECATGPDG